MKHKNELSFRLWGMRAMFSDPVTRVGGEHCSYPLPTYQALKGVTESIFWKPTIVWRIDAVRVMKPIIMESQNVRPICYNGKNTLSIYTYLANVEYQVRAHFEWNETRSDLEQDRNENKHFYMAKRSLEKGGRRDVFLGSRECQGYVEPCDFGSGEGAYDNTPETSFGLMFHGFDYPDETGVNELGVRFWEPKLDKGVVTFISPQECEVRRKVKEKLSKLFEIGKNMESIDAAAAGEGYT